MIDFRQAVHGDQREHDRGDAADIEQDLPTVGRDKGGAGEPGQRPAKRHHARRDNGKRSASVARRRLGIDRDDVGNDAANAETGDEAQFRQFGEIGRVGGNEGKDAEQEVGGDQRGLAAVAITDPAEDLRAEQHAEIAGAQHEAKVFRRDMPFLDQAGHGERDGADVISVDEGNQDRPEDQLDLERADAVLIQKMRNLNFLLAGHRSPLQGFLIARETMALTPPRKAVNRSGVA